MTSSGLSQRSSAKRSPSASSASSVPLKSKKSVPISEEDEDFYQEYEARRSASDRDDDDDERDSKRVHRRSSSSARSRSSRSNQPSMSAQISFAQLLVFGTLMLQALTLFVTYHMLLTTQHGQKTFDSVGASISQLQIEVTRLHGEMSVISKQVIEIGKVQAATKRMVILGNGSSNQNQDESENEEAANEESSEESENTNSENAETSEEGQSNEESSENESSSNEEQSSTDEYSSDKYLNDDGSVNEAALESVIEQIESAHPPPLPSGARLKVGGNRLMTLRPSDLEKLHQYRNWTEDAQGKHYDAGPTFNQTNAIMEKLGQLIVSDSGEPIAPVDIAIVEHVRDDRTTIAARDIKRGEYFYKIHQDYLLTSIVVEHSEVGQELTANDFDGEEMVWMTAFILYEKVNPQSYWKFWLNILPISYRHMPQTFDWVNELDILENTMAGQWVSEYQLQYRREYISLASALRNYNFSQFSFAQYVWARLAVASRAFGLDVYRTKRMSDEALAQLQAEGKEPGTEMVHITCMSAADLINHEGEHRKIDAIWGWNEATHHFAFKAVKDIPAGTVIHTTYGPRGNSDIFVHYGFSLPGNPYNTAQLCVAGLKSSPLHSEKQSLLEEVYGTGDRASEWDTCSQRLPKNSPPGYMCRFHMDVLNDNAQECLQFARISVADEKSFKEHVLSVHENDLKERQEKAAENEEAAQDSKWAVLDIDPFDYQVEVEALGLLGDMAAIALRRFKGGPAINDTHLIQAGAAAKKMGICQDPTDTLGWYPQGNCLTHNQYNLLMVRQSEKAVLEGAVELGLMANAFHHLEPATIEDAYKFIARLSYTKEALDQMKKQDITPQYSHLRYFNEHFLPLYFRHKGWDVDTNEDGTRSPLAERNLQLYQLYRSIYVEPANEEDITDDDNEFAFE